MTTPTTNAKPILIATVGLPRSGKTTWARNSRWLGPVVNPDSIRLALHGQRFCASAEPFVWAIAKIMVRSLFLAGHSMVILDATNTTRKRRDEWQSDDWITYFKVLPTSKEECLLRAAGDTKIIPVIERMKEECLIRAAGDTEIIPVIERMAVAFEPLGADENLW